MWSFSETVPEAFSNTFKETFAFNFVFNSGTGGFSFLQSLRRMRIKGISHMK